MKNPYTSKTHPMQVQKFDTVIAAALPAIVRARELGARSAYQFAMYLNSAGIAAPNEVFWYDVAVLAALRRLKHLGLDQGSLPKGQAAIVGGGGPGNAFGCRLLEEKLKKAGWASRNAVNVAVPTTATVSVSADDGTDDDPLHLKKLFQKLNI